MNTKQATAEQKDPVVPTYVKRTTLSTIVKLLLREHRLIKGIGLVHMSTQLGYPNGSAWSRVESGGAKLKLDTLCKATEFLCMLVSQLLDQAEKTSLILSSNGWRVLAESDLHGRQDDLLTLAKTHTKKQFTWNPEKYGYFLMPSFAIQAIQA